MSERYPGGIISKTAPTVTTSSAPGIWTLEQQAAYQKAGTWPFGGPFNYIEDVFSTWLYTGDSSTQTITNGIDLAGKGGLVWVKRRTTTASFHLLTDTVRGAGTSQTANNGLASNSSDNTTGTASDYVSAFTSTGFSVTAGGSAGPSYRSANTAANDYVAWTFREQSKFFDIVTYTGNGANRTISHNLGSVPGCIIIKRTDTTGNWAVYHRSLANTEYMVLNTTAAKATGATYWNSTTPTSTVFSLGTATDVNANGGTYVAYLFAHDAGGFGLTGTDNVISCGSFTTDGSGNATINLGYEPQFLLFKSTNNAADWRVVDNMRGFPNVSTLSGVKTLSPNLSQVEAAWSGGGAFGPTSTGFQFYAGFGGPAASNENIYIAIRRGPMKTPTSGTSVYQGYTYTGDGTNSKIFSGLNFPADLAMWLPRNKNPITFNAFNDRLRGFDTRLETTSTAAEASSTTQIQAVNNTNFQLGAASGSSGYNYSGLTVVIEFLRRAPGFMDEVCYTGNGTTQNVTHNLGVAPELIIAKRRNTTTSWYVYSAPTGNANHLLFNFDSAVTSGTVWNNTTPTSTVFSVGNNVVNGGGGIFVAYLFASCPGVSKVGSYSGTGATQTISCGFAARFVMIKRTDSTGNWWVWDTARGMTAGTDPRLAFNSTAAELTDAWVLTNASGFQIVTTDATVNASGGTYIYLAIA